MYIKENLLTNFKVNKVEYDPYAESLWLLRHKNLPQFWAVEQLFETLKTDEQLAGGEIEAQIDLSSCEVLPAVKKEKSMSFQGNVITATGIYEDDVSYSIEHDTYYDHIISSIFPLRVSLEIDPIPVKKGEWITVSGEAFLILPRGVNLK